jgi:hypothetical protein
MRPGPIALATAMLAIAACTSAPTTTTPTVTTAPSTGTTSPSTGPSEEPTGPTVLGAALPDGCDQGEAKPSQTVAFVADGRAWALSPGGTLTCLFETTDPGPFTWGPQGDRVVLGGGDVRFPFGGDDRAATGLGAAPFDWGRPIGKAIVYVPAEAGGTRKLFMDDGSDEALSGLPNGTYEDIAYHPSGLALALSVKAKDGTPGIYVSTNEGDRADRIVVGVSATDFPSVDFTSDGRYLLYLAEHKGDYVQLHMIDLEHPDSLVNLWKGPVGVRATGLRLPPAIGDTLAFTTGSTCEDSQAVWGSVNEVAPVLPGEDRPTVAIGYLDARRLLVGARDCAAGTSDLFVVSDRSSELVATGVDVAAARSNGPDGAVPLPEELLGQVQEFG